MTLLATASWSVSGLRAAAGARRHRGHGGEGGGGGVARRVLQLRGLRRRARRPPLLLLLRHGPDLLRQASVWFCNVGIDVKRCCTVHTFHTQESIKIENSKYQNSTPGTSRLSSGSRAAPPATSSSSRRSLCARSTATGTHGTSAAGGATSRSPAPSTSQH